MANGIEVIEHYGEESEFGIYRLTMEDGTERILLQRNDDFGVFENDVGCDIKDSIHTGITDEWRRKLYEYLAKNGYRPNQRNFY